MKQYTYLWVIVSAIGLLVGVDLVAKYLLYDHAWGSYLALLQPAMNYGISLSFEMSYWIVIPLSVLALGLFYHLYRRADFSMIVFVLLCAGTLGNLYDRVVYDGVRDFFVMPGLFIYNIADVYLFIAMVMAGYALFINNYKGK